MFSLFTSHSFAVSFEKNCKVPKGSIKIIKIDGEETDEFNIDDAAKLIRGKKGTEVVLSIQRYGEIELIDFVLTRETIPVKDISYSGMLNENTGYIRLTRFSTNSDKEN